MSKLSPKQRVRVIGTMHEGMTGTVNRVREYPGRFINPYAVVLDGNEPRELWFCADELEPIPEPRP